MDPVATTGTQASNALEPVLRPALPFLKWAGGKRQLLPALRSFYPRRFRAYHEPFVGSGAVFFDLANAGRLQGHRVRLADVHPDLIGCWQRLRDEPKALIKHLDDLARGHRASPAAHYLRVRDRQFNPARERIRNGTGPRSDAYTAKLAAMFIYLNRTGFNGLFRVNGQGRFNVPQGRYANPRICDEPEPPTGRGDLVGVAADDRAGNLPFRARGSARGRLCLFRSTLRANQTDRAFHLLHGRPLRRRRPTSAPAGRDRPRRAGVPPSAQQLDCPGDCRTLRRQPRGGACRPPGPAGSRLAAPSTPTRSAVES